jgi:hypothetical protein
LKKKKNLLSHLSLNLRIIFGLDFKCLTNTDSPVKFAQSFDFVQGALGKRLQNSFWNITELFTEEGRKLREDCKYLTEFAYQIIENRRKNPETLREATDVLNLFMEAKYDNGENMTDKQLIDVVLNFIIAGTFFFKKNFLFGILHSPHKSICII